MAPTPKSLAKSLFAILKKDLDVLERIDCYYNGNQDDPYMPENADAEYKLLASRCTSNWMPLLVGTPAQALYVDGFRPSRDGDSTSNPEWTHWQDSRLDARQTAIHRGALKHGHSFTVTEVVGEKVITRGLSALRTAALYEDPANDITPYAALTVVSWPRNGESSGTAKLWTSQHVYDVTFKGYLGTLAEKDIAVKGGKRHGASECPVTRFAASVDLEGRTVGVVEPMIALQNRINQTVFDLLVAQTYGSFKVRWVTGMAPPVKRDPDSGEALVDADGNEIAEDVELSARRVMFAESVDTKFGTLDETPLGGYIESIDMSVRHLAAVSQTPPHHLLGQIANLSADALQAAETSLARKVQEFRVNFGESWERVFRLAGELRGDASVSADNAGEVIWRDMESRSMAQVADALGKLSESAGVPQRALWSRVPGVTQTELAKWNEMADEEDAELQLASALTRATNPEPIAAQAA